MLSILSGCANIIADGMIVGQDNDEQAQKYYGIALTDCLVSSLVAPQFDDITMMCLLYKGQKGENERGEALDQ